MNWIEDRVAERESIARRNQLIKASAEKFFNSLWEEIEQWLVEARDKGGFLIHTNGTPYERMIFASISPPPSQPSRNPKTLTVKLTKDKSAIVASEFGVPPVKLLLDVCPNDLVCLKHNDKQVSMSEAAILVLDPFLFPRALAPELRTDCELSGNY